MKYRYISPHILELYWPAEISKEILLEMIRLKKSLHLKWGNELKNIVMGYHCLSLHFGPVINFPLVLSEIEDIRQSNDFNPLQERKRWYLPVCYDLEFGKDLLNITKTKNLSIEKIVDLHSKTTYLLYFYGFLPGFMYLGGLSKSLYLPRKRVPDRKIEKGSLAIGGIQTGIYPMDSPGGWSVIGKTPINIFNIQSKGLVPAEPGDEVKFQEIDKNQFYHLLEQDVAGRYALKHEIING